MIRIFFIWLLAVMTTVFLAHAQQSAKVRTIGFLSSAGAPSDALKVLRQALRDLGWKEGTKIAIENRPDGEGSGLADNAMELVRMKVDVIVTTGGISTRAAQKATTTIPIIFTSSGDPIEGGFIDSLARPGKNLTGVTFLAYELVGKRLELLKEAVPSVSRVAVIVNPAHPGEQRELSETQSIARALGLTLDHHPVRSKTDYETVFDAISKKKANGLLVFPDAATLANATRIAEFVAKQRLPSMFGWKEYVETGGLMAYGPNRDEAYRRIAVHVDKILKGTKPTDIPTELPMRFELVINLKAAKQIGLTIPPNVLVRADRVIR
jgi:putative ABC transport system substrate-binding protein